MDEDGEPKSHRFEKLIDNFIWIADAPVTWFRGKNTVLFLSVVVTQTQTVTEVSS